ncbi:MAG TPA: hypothetical protein DCY20_03470 [Firmicutes bacterium]|nr:hypothetical protein [Bacillota bacterium]
MKQLDKWIIGIVLSISAVFMVSFFQQPSVAKADEARVIISIMGNVVYEVSLNGGSQEYKLASEYGYNEIVIDDEGVRVLVSDCDDHVCETVGVISKIGQSIICAPHFLVVEIVA